MSFLLIASLPKPLTQIALHEHPFYEITLCTKGEGIAEIGNAKYPFHAGSILIIPPDTPHKSRANNGFREIYMQTDHPLPMSAGDPHRGVICLEDDGEKSVTSLMQMMLQRYIRSHKNDSTLTLMCELLMQLLAEKCDALQSDPAVEDVRRLLALHYNDPQLSLARLLESTGYHRDYIRRRFIAACGVTPGEYLTSLRIENAKKLLKCKNEMQLSIADIGAMCGYYDTHYFSRVFKKHVGVAPARYVTE